MDVILVEKVKNLGILGDRVKVKAGYARNFLVPYGKAVPATEANVAEFAKRRADYEARAAQLIAAAEARKSLLEGATITLRANASMEGKLYGSVGAREISEAMAIPVEELDSLLRQALTISSLDAPINAEDGRSFLGDLIADASAEEPLDRIERGMHQEQLAQLMAHLSAQEKEVLALRFGLDGLEQHTLAEIGRQLDVSRERVRQIELKALRKLRSLSTRSAPLS